MGHRIMSVNDAFFRKQAAGLRQLAGESSDATRSALMELAQEYDALSASPKSWPPRASGPQNKAVPGEDGAITEAVPAIVERRRPGRAYYANPALIKLLRARAGDGTEHNLIAGPIEDAESDLTPAKGILIGVVLALSMWSAGGLLFWLMR
jgi:hypothetical protein